MKPAELKELLGLVCPGKEYIGQESGCRVCPSQTGRAGAQIDSSIESAVPGHFLDPKSDDLLLVLYGCATRAEDARHAFLFTRSDSGWFVSRASGVPAGRCRKIKNRQGRDGLVCFNDAISTEESKASLTFGYAGEQGLELAHVFDNTGGVCSAPQRPVIQSAIRQVSFLTGTGGKLTVRIQAECRRGPLSARSRKACAAGPGFEEIGPAVPFRTVRIDYVFNGETFSPVPYSQAAKRALDACTAGT